MSDNDFDSFTNDFDQDLFPGLYDPTKKLEVNHFGGGATGFVVREKPTRGPVAGLSLSDRDTRELAFKLLERKFDIVYGGNLPNSKITLTPKRPPVEVGQFYRVLSTDEMSLAFQGDPLVKVTEVFDRAHFTVQTQIGAGSGWAGVGPEHNLEGPIEVEEVVTTVWVEKDERDDFDRLGD